MSIAFDPVKARTNLRKHGVSFSHAEQTLRDPMAYTIEDPDAATERRFVTLGTDALGRGAGGGSHPTRRADATHFRSQGQSW